MIVIYVNTIFVWSTMTQYHPVAIFPAVTSCWLLKKVYTGNDFYPNRRHRKMISTIAIVTSSTTLTCLTWQVPVLCHPVIHIEAKTKWLPFCKQHFQLHFLEWKSPYLDKNFTEIVASGLIENKSALVQLMAWGLCGTKPLPELMMTQCTDAYICDCLNVIIHVHMT